MRAIGLAPGSARDFETFAREAVVVAARVEHLPENPGARFDPAEGETWEFHLALRRALDEGAAAVAREGIARAVGGSRGFRLMGEA